MKVENIETYNKEIITNLNSRKSLKKEEQDAKPFYSMLIYCSNTQLDYYVLLTSLFDGVLIMILILFMVNILTSLHVSVLKLETTIHLSPPYQTYTLNIHQLSHFGAASFNISHAIPYVTCHRFV